MKSSRPWLPVDGVQGRKYRGLGRRRPFVALIERGLVEYVRAVDIAYVPHKAEFHTV
jgi:hypothetical protein